MKTDEIPFTFVTAIVLAGALLAVVSPSKSAVTTSVPAAHVMAAHTVTSPVSNVTPGVPTPSTEVDVTE